MFGYFQPILALIGPPQFTCRTLGKILKVKMGLSHFNKGLEKLVKAILSKIQENFCKGLDFGIRTQVCSCIQVQTLQKLFLYP